MTDTPDWLPRLVYFQDYGGDWACYIDAVYQYFKKDFIDSNPEFGNKVVRLKRYPLFQNKEYSFWHVTSEGDEEEHRTPDLRRCERIRWPRPIIEHYTDTDIRCWQNKRGQDKYILFWFYEQDYLVVLADRKRYVLLWTAYVVSWKHTREKLKREYDAYIKRLTPPQ